MRAALVAVAVLLVAPVACSEPGRPAGAPGATGAGGAGGATGATASDGASGGASGGAGGGGTAKGGDATFDPRLLGGWCSPFGHVDGPEPGSFVAEPGAWVRVTSIDLASGRDDGTYRGDYAVVGGDRSVLARLPAEVTDVDLADRQAEAVRLALGTGADVWVHVRYDPQPLSGAFALAVRRDEFAFLGGCQYRMLTKPMAERIGPDAARRLAAVVGKPADDVEEVVGLRDPNLPDTSVRLAASPDARSWLRRGWLSVDLPDDWRGRYAICPGVAQGWGECVPLADGAPARVRMWFDPLREVAVYLFATPPEWDDPVGLVLVARMPELLRKAKLDPAKDTVELRVSWEQPPPFDAVREGGAPPQHGVTWRVVAA